MILCDVIDFGTVTFQSYYVNHDGVFFGWVPSVSASFGQLDPGQQFPAPTVAPGDTQIFAICSQPCTPQLPEYTYELQYTIPVDENSIEISWSGNIVGYVATVPEPSIWAMLLIGFAGIGALSYRRSRPRLTVPTTRAMRLEPENPKHLMVRV
jgi:hypothetical protein